MEEEEEEEEEGRIQSEEELRETSKIYREQLFYWTELLSVEPENKEALEMVQGLQEVLELTNELLFSKETNRETTVSADLKERAETATETAKETETETVTRSETGIGAAIVTETGTKTGTETVIEAATEIPTETATALKTGTGTHFYSQIEALVQPQIQSEQEIETEIENEIHVSCQQILEQSNAHNFAGSFGPFEKTVERENLNLQLAQVTKDRERASKREEKGTADEKGRRGGGGGEMEYGPILSVANANDKKYKRETKGKRKISNENESHLSPNEMEGPADEFLDKGESSAKCLRVSIGKEEKNNVAFRRRNMHPNNKYAEEEPNFEQLAEKYSSLRPYVLPPASGFGRSRINWKDYNATRELTKALLHHDFGISWWIQDGQLCPTVPNRINYIHWLQDLIVLSPPPPPPQIRKNSEKSVRVIDIGTGANCIYPLLGATIYGWKFVATDVTEAAITGASENLRRNPKLSSLIELRRSTILENNDLCTQTQIVSKNGNNSETFCCNMASEERSRDGSNGVLIEAELPSNSVAVNFGVRWREGERDGRNRKARERDGGGNGVREEVRVGTLEKREGRRRGGKSEGEGKGERISIPDFGVNPEKGRLIREGEVGEEGEGGGGGRVVGGGVVGGGGGERSGEVETMKAPILVGVVGEGEKFDMCMCNPPFFENMEQSGLNPHSSCGGTVEEMVCPGGEEGFIRQIIEDSVELRDQIHWFTTLVGLKQHIKSLSALLWQKKVAVVRTTEFVQGRTSRWGLAWSFSAVQSKLSSTSYLNSKLSFTLQGVGKRISAWEVLQALSTELKKYGTVSSVDKNTFSLTGFTVQKTSSFKAEVFQQAPGTLTIKAFLLQDQNISLEDLQEFAIQFNVAEVSLRKKFSLKGSL